MARYKYVEVEVDLTEFDDDSLVEELESRGYDCSADNDMRLLLEKIWANRRIGKDYQSELDALIYGVLGKIV